MYLKQKQKQTAPSNFVSSFLFLFFSLPVSLFHRSCFCFCFQFRFPALVSIE